MGIDITLPYNYTRRPYQKEIREAHKSGIKRIVAVRSRRAGKDKELLNDGICIASRKAMNAYYVFPTYNQGRKIFRDGVDNDGFRNIDHFPDDLVIRNGKEKGNSTQMKIQLVNGSIFQAVGTDKNMDALAGTNAQHIIMSEYSLQNPMARKNILSPIVDMND